ncbi:MAG: AraC family transcriptional regulator [Rhodobacteraceae bacterium]|nr:AraC family transcriptional regulator [Paracoccaceae bacterium]MCY4250952.1 AraC family transcriptional regulator [Paracoccaceae bacterium]MCY4309172.1 AraC family transcriptional regulator [Paracoccaceae bacterium]
MSLISPELEIVDRSLNSIRYLEHGWPTDLCRWHSHEEYELHLIVNTRGKAFVGDHIGGFEPGSLYLTGPLLPHNWVTDDNFSEPVNLRDMLIQFNHDSIQLANEAYPEFRELLLLLSKAESGVEFIGFKLDESIKRFEDIRNAKGLKQIILFLDFLLCLSQWKTSQILSASQLINKNWTKNYSNIAKVIEYIIANYKEDIKLSQLAEMACMSQSAFSRHFFNTTGNHYSDFLNRIRIGQACAKLYETNEHISTICYDVGFRNLANFNRQFLRIKGVQPRVFRSEARKELAI